MIAAGIDAGSTTWKGVLVDESGKVLARRVERAEPRMDEQSARNLGALLAEAGIAKSDLSSVVATGYGRKLVRDATQIVTEITCHARSIGRTVSGARTVLDVGGQDSKAILLANGGRVENFVMNDKCAAGTGRFLEVSARSLGVALEDIGRIAASRNDPVAISSTCTVFAESEVISLLASGVSVERILAGLHRSLTDRLVSLLMQVGWKAPLVMSGGVAKNEGIVKALGAALSTVVVVPADPQLMGAYGAALTALFPNKHGPG